MLKLKNPGLIPIVFIVVSTAALLALSAWQFKRLAWKEGLIVQIETAMHAPAVSTLEGDVAYRKATLTGHFDTAHSLHFVGSKSGGFHHFVPFTLEDGAVLLVNTGWYAKDKGPSLASSETTVEGVLRPFRQRRMFSPENAVEKNIWFIEDTKQIEAQTGLRVAPYVLETGKLPALRNDHLGYAITWLLLAVTGIVMFLIYFRKK